MDKTMFVKLLWTVVHAIWGEVYNLTYDKVGDCEYVSAKIKTYNLRVIHIDVTADSLLAIAKAEKEPATAATVTSPVQIVEDNVSDVIITPAADDVKSVETETTEPPAEVENVPNVVIKACREYRQMLKKRIADEQAYIDKLKSDLADIIAFAGDSDA